jgi:hypothetical protein
MYRSCQLSKLLFSGMAVLQQHNPYAIVLRASNKTLSFIHQVSNTRCWPSATMLNL